MTGSLIAVDIGNSVMKLGVFPICADGDPLHPRHVFEFPTRGAVLQRLSQRLPADKCHWRVASVQRQAQQQLWAWVREHRPNDEYRLLNYRDLPLAVEVDYPERVGMDRLAAAVAVNRLRAPERAAIVVDVGTAVTVDLVGAAGVFLGGAILPGPQMAARALASDTDLLPLAPVALSAEPPPVIGKSTEAAIHSGLFWGTVGAVREVAARIADQISLDRKSVQPQLFVTGGGARNLAPLISGEAQVVQELVLSGIILAAWWSFEGKMEGSHEQEITEG